MWPKWVQSKRGEAFLLTVGAFSIHPNPPNPSWRFEHVGSVPAACLADSVR